MKPATRILSQYNEKPIVASACSGVAFPYPLVVFSFPLQGNFGNRCCVSTLF